jgi:hypothetical protein
MNPADEMAAKIGRTERQSADAAAGVIDKLDEQLRVSVEALLHPSPPLKPVEEVDALLLAISRHLDDEASERKAVRNRLLAIEHAMERLASRGFRYLVAILSNTDAPGGGPHPVRKPGVVHRRFGANLLCFGMPRASARR